MSLLYDASDLGFAFKAVAALRAAGIPCYMDREGLPGDPIDHLTGLPISAEDAKQSDLAEAPEPDAADFEFPPGTDIEAEGATQGYAVASARHCCIYIDDDEDYQRASEILVELGAARAPAISATEAEWINRWTAAVALLAVVLVALYVWENWKH